MTDRLQITSSTSLNADQLQITSNTSLAERRTTNGLA